MGRRSWMVVSASVLLGAVGCTTSPKTEGSPSTVVARTQAVAGRPEQVAVSTSSSSEVETTLPSAAPPSAIDAQLQAAAQVVCRLMAADEVTSVFALTTTLTTQPMGEAGGPACGYPNLDGRGYLLVIQFQPWSRWDEHIPEGRQVDVGATRGILAADGRGGSWLYIRDTVRHVTATFLAPQTTSASEDQLLRLARLVYGPGR